jgi:peptide/nickel transport system permease protein
MTSLLSVRPESAEGGYPVRRRRRKGGRRVPVTASVILAIVLICAVFAPLIAPHNPGTGSLEGSLVPPVWSHGGSWTHILGTDQLGQDVLSRLIYGSRVTMEVALAGVAVAGVIGSALGVIAGYFGGLVDEVIMRVADAALAIPLLILGLALATVLGPGTINVIITVSALTWAFFARQVRAEVLSLRSSDYVEAVRLMGIPRTQIITRHVLPNVANSIIVIATLQVGNTVIIASSLSFLGLGVPQNTPEWGLMLANAEDYLTIAPVMLLAPAIALAVTVLAANVFGDWVRDRLDPKSSGRLA